MMHELKFQGLGTHWLVAVDQSDLPANLDLKIDHLISSFESQYSRFKTDSEITKLKSSPSPYSLSSDLREMLTLGLELEHLTLGHFNLNIGQLISGLGYDQSYSFNKDNQKIESSLSSFSLKGNQLLFNAPLQLDLGALGKGFLIDKIKAFLDDQDITHYLIDGGGDVYATSKQGHIPWKIAIEHPLDESQAIGLISLQNQAIASSSSQKRKHEDFHHLLNPITKRPSSRLLAVSVLSSSAFIADALATALFVSPQNLWPKLISKFKLEYLAVYPDLHADFSLAFSNLF